MPLPRGYKRKKLRNWRTYCAKGSIRTLLRGTTRVFICCPKGKWKPRAHRCKVGTRAFAIDKKGFGSALTRGASKELREHPWAGKKLARRIAADHLRKNRRAYGE